MQAHVPDLVRYDERSFGRRAHVRREYRAALVVEEAWAVVERRIAGREPGEGPVGDGRWPPRPAPSAPRGAAVASAISVCRRAASVLTGSNASMFSP